MKTVLQFALILAQETNLIVIRLRIIGLAFLLIAPLSGCDQVNDVVNKQKSNGKAVGAACRHGGRALEDCYKRNPKVAKSDIYAGWKEMNEYMQAKKLDIVRPKDDGDAEDDKDVKKVTAPASATASAASAVKAASSVKAASTGAASKAPAKN